MNKKFTKLFGSLVALALIIAIPFKINAAVGDTTVVYAHNAVHMSSHGNYSAWAAFPDSTKKYGKLVMKYRIGCPSQACSSWDYTTQVLAEVSTGAWDSTVVQYPDFKVDGNLVSPFKYNTAVTYITYFNSTFNVMDSFPATQQLIEYFADPLNPTIVTSFSAVYPGNYYNHIYNSSGVVIDSSYVGFSNTLSINYHNVYTPFKVKEPFELARVMTPYGSTFSNTWGRDYFYDLTDYATILKDSINIRIFYDGWSDGFAATVTFYFIEGTPPRNVKRVRNIYPDSFYVIGNAANPVENRLTLKTFDINSDEKMALIRVIPSGHGAGTSNCAEFCSKSYKLLINGTQRFTQAIWRNDCGLNPLMAQNGTWIYDRANWCPGEKTLRKDHDLTPYITPGTPLTIDMNLDAYTNTVTAQSPGYYIDSHLITYDSINFVYNAAVEEIVSPNSDIDHVRVNPICKNPIVVIKNYGSQVLTSCNVNFGIKGGAVQTYNWTGSLAFNQSATVNLGSMSWGSNTGTPNIFQAWTSNPNGNTDQYIYNDTLTTYINFTSMLPPQFMIYWKTNTAYLETTYTLKDDLGNIIYSNKPLIASTIYKDTVNLAPGCYELRFNDSGKDGLNFPYGSAGVGFAQLKKTDGTFATLKALEGNFGTSLVYNFTVGFVTGVDEKFKDVTFQLAPNPSHGLFSVNLILPKKEDVQIMVLNQLGQTISVINKPAFNQEYFDINLEGSPAGMYYVVMKTNSNVITKKLVIE